MLLLFTPMKSVFLRRSTPSKEKYKMHGSRRKGAPGSRSELNPMVTEVNRLKILNGVKRAVTSRQDHTQLGFHLVKRN